MTARLNSSSSLSRDRVAAKFRFIAQKKGRRGGRGGGSKTKRDRDRRTRLLPESGKEKLPKISLERNNGGTLGVLECRSAYNAGRSGVLLIFRASKSTYRVLHIHVYTNTSPPFRDAYAMHAKGRERSSPVLLSFLDPFSLTLSVFEYDTRVRSIRGERGGGVFYFRLLGIFYFSFSFKIIIFFIVLPENLASIVLKMR